MNHRTRTALVLAFASLAGQAFATTIDFEDLAVNSVLSTQYAGLGVTFSANAFSGPGSSSVGTDWATNTDMTIVSSTGSDVGGLGSPALVSGNMLHGQSGWNNEDGDPSFLITFAAPISSFSATFAGVNSAALAADVTIWAFDGMTQVGMASGSSAGQLVLSLNAASITSVAVRPGSFVDWVGVDNINFTAAAVPEASTYAMMGLGLALLAFKRRKSA